MNDKRKSTREQIEKNKAEMRELPFVRDGVLVATAKQLAENVSMETKMPNGKPLGDCTTAELAEFADQYATLASVLSAASRLLGTIALEAAKK